jgi:hypothetical protein
LAEIADGLILGLCLNPRLRFRFAGPRGVGDVEGVQGSQRASSFEECNVRIAELGVIHDNILRAADCEKSSRFLRWIVGTATWGDE